MLFEFSTEESAPGVPGVADPIVKALLAPQPQ